MSLIQIAVMMIAAGAVLLVVIVIKMTRSSEMKKVASGQRSRSDIGQERIDNTFLVAAAFTFLGGVALSAVLFFVTVVWPKFAG